MDGRVLDGEEIIKRTKLYAKLSNFERDLIATIMQMQRDIERLRQNGDDWRQLCSDTVTKNITLQTKNTAMREALDAYEKECTALENCERLLRHIRNCMYEFNFDVSTIDSDIWDAVDKCLEKTRSII